MVQLVVISRLNSQSIDYQTAMLLNTIGTDALKIYNGFAFDNGDTRDIATILKKFDEQIIGELNETYERYKFNSRKQATGERFDMYLTELRHLAKNCNFCNCLCDTLLRDRIVMGIHDNETRKRLLEMKDITLDRCVDVCRAASDVHCPVYTQRKSTMEIAPISPTEKQTHATHANFVASNTK